MSDEERMVIDSDSDNEPFYVDSDGDDLEDIRREAEERRAAQLAAATAQPVRPTPQARQLPTRGGIFGGRTNAGFGADALRAQAGAMPGRGNLFGDMAQAMFGPGGLGGMLGGGHASASAFRIDLKAWSVSIHEAGEGRMERINGGRQNVMFGGNILLPSEALDLLTRLDIEGPWTFEMINPRDQSLRTHAGVLEFTAPEGTVYLPQWMMDQLKLTEGDSIRIQGAALPKGKFVKLQPQELTFLELSDPKAVLEKALPNYVCLTVGDIIEISHQLINLRFQILEIKPEEAKGINILNTDIEVDFAPPVGYVEPERKPREPAPTMASKMKINIGGTNEVGAEAEKFSAFLGQGNSLAGKKIKGKGTKTKKVDALDPESRIRRTDRQTFINANADSGTRTVPAALHLPFGHLFFGYTHVPLKASGTTDLAKAEGVEPAPSFVGSGATLSGRMRNQPAAIKKEEIKEEKEKENTSSFAGQGNSLSGPAKPKKEIIEID